VDVILSLNNLIDRDGVMNLRSEAVVLMMLACACVVVAEPAGEIRETTERLAGSVYTGPAMGTLRELSDDFAATAFGMSVWNHSRYPMDGFAELLMENCSRRVPVLCISSLWDGLPQRLRAGSREK
jgi:hypothetical protein